MSDAAARQGAWARGGLPRTCVPPRHVVDRLKRLFFKSVRYELVAERTP